MSWWSKRISAETVRKVRKECGEYQVDFAKRLGVHKRTIIRWEKDGCEWSYYGTRADRWRALVKKYPKAFTKAEREFIRK